MEETEKTGATTAACCRTQQMIEGFTPAKSEMRTDSAGLRRSKSSCDVKLQLAIVPRDFSRAVNARFGNKRY